MSRRITPSVIDRNVTGRRLRGPTSTTDDEYLHEIGAASPHDARRAHAPLTARQQVVLRGVFDGLSNKEIGAQIGVSESAVKATVQQLFRKLRSRTRAQLVRRVVEGAPEMSRGLHA